MSNWIPSGHLDWMQDSAELLLPDYCHILSATFASDGQGGSVETWGTLTQWVKCRVDYQSGKEAISAESLTPFERAMITLPIDAVITPYNRVELVTSGVVFAVVSVNRNQSWGVVKRVVCERISRQ